MDDITIIILVVIGLIVLGLYRSYKKKPTETHIPNKPAEPTVEDEDLDINDRKPPKV